MNKSLSRDDVYKILNDFSVDYGDEGFDIYYGNGLPDISKIVYTDNECYSYSLPQGELTLTKGVDYTQSNRPWRPFDSKIISVNVEKSVSSIGDWTFTICQMPILLSPAIISLSERVHFWLFAP